MGKTKTDKPEKNNKKQKHFWKDFKAELKKVIWPTRSQVITNTIIVLVIVLIVTAIVFVLDLAFEALNTYGIDNLKTVVQEMSKGSDSEENLSTDDTSSEEKVVENASDTDESYSSETSEEADDTAEVENISE